MAYRFTEDTREAHPELMDRPVTESEVREVYERDIDRNIETGGYADFDDWLMDMLKTGLIREEPDIRTPSGREKSSDFYPLRFCRPVPSPYPLGERGQYDFYVERLYPKEGNPGASRIGPVIYIGTGKEAQKFTGIINGPPTDYRDSLLQCAEMRRSLGIRIMEGEDYFPENLAVDRPALETWAQHRSLQIIQEMGALGYFFDASKSDSAITGRKVFTGYLPGGNDIVFPSDKEALQWILDHPGTDRKRTQALYEQLNPEDMEEQLKERKERYQKSMEDTFRLDEEEPDQKAIFSPAVPNRKAGIRR